MHVVVSRESRGQLAHFLRHLLEMLLAMMLGMFAGGAVFVAANGIRPRTRSRITRSRL